MKKIRTEVRPQPGELAALERCLDRGELDKASERLARLQGSFPGFKPLKRLAYLIARHGGQAARATLTAWEWCAASPNSEPACKALSDSCGSEFPYLQIYAAQALQALGDEAISPELPVLRAALPSGLSEAEGLAVDLARIFLACGRAAEASEFVAAISHPMARNQFALALFAQGKIEQAETAWTSVLAATPDNLLALQRLAMTRLWRSGRDDALDVATRLLDLPPNTIDDACLQMEAAILFGLSDRAEARYLAAAAEPAQSMPGAPDGSAASAHDRLHMLGALIAWRQQRQDEVEARLSKIDDPAGELDGLRAQCMLFRLMGDTPDWSVSKTSHCWPADHILSLKPEKFIRDSELFERWQAPMPHTDYLASIALNGGKGNRETAIAALKFLVESNLPDKPAASRELVLLLQLPCGPDAVRSKLHRWLIEKGVLENEAPVSLFVSGKLTEIRPLNITIHTGVMTEESTLRADDKETYEQVLNLISQGNYVKSLPLIERLLERYPNYPRILSAAASLREASGEPTERWAPLIHKAVEIDPHYLFSRAALAKLLAGEGRIEEAREQLAPLLELKTLHASEWRSLLLAQIAVAKATSDLPLLRRLNDMLRDSLERFG